MSTLIIQAACNATDVVEDDTALAYNLGVCPHGSSGKMMGKNKATDGMLDAVWFHFCT